MGRRYLDPHLLLAEEMAIPVRFLTGSSGERSYLTTADPSITCALPLRQLLLRPRRAANERLRVILGSKRGPSRRSLMAPGALQG